MTARPRNITFDCADPYAQVKFWSQVTGYQEDPENPNEPGDPEGFLAGPDGQPGLLFIPVPEAKTVKNRVHLDLTPTDRTRDEEVERLLGIGATLVADHRRPDGTGWVVLADPEGNEFLRRAQHRRTRRQRLSRRGAAPPISPRRPAAGGSGSSRSGRVMGRPGGCSSRPTRSRSGCGSPAGRPRPWRCRAARPP
jgi:catechol 2,3-dioxygenase-like lactoylglutathione lyase family enzyme